MGRLDGGHPFLLRRGAELIQRAAFPGELSRRGTLLAQATYRPRTAELRLHGAGYAICQAGKQDGPRGIF
jgi:hypothetical protein